MTDYSSLRFNFIQIWRITLHIFIELFLRNDLIKFIQTLQTWCKLWYTSSTHLQHIFITSSTQHTIFENRSSKLFKHFIVCRSSSQHLFQHSLSDRHFIHHASHTFTTLSQHTFQILHHNNWVTDYLTTLIILCRGVNDRCFILFNNLWTILSQQFHHNNFITTISSQLMNHKLWTISSQQFHHNNFITTYESQIMNNTFTTISSQQFHHNLWITVYESYVNTFSQTSSQDLFQQTLNTSSS